MRADALAALGELGDSRAVPLLVRAMYEEPHWTCQLQASERGRRRHVSAIKIFIFGAWQARGRRRRKTQRHSERHQ